MVLVHKRENLTDGFLNYLEKYAKNNVFAIFLRNSLQIFENFLKLPKFWVFRPNSQKNNAWFVKFLGKIC